MAQLLLDHGRDDKSGGGSGDMWRRGWLRAPRNEHGLDAAFVTGDGVGSGEDLSKDHVLLEVLVWCDLYASSQ